VHALLNVSSPHSPEIAMRTPLICAAVGLLLLTACDKKKAAPTEGTGSIRDVRTVPGATLTPGAVQLSTHVG
jgi:hypothetical protein